jgi:hypothetical protein
MRRRSYVRQPNRGHRESGSPGPLDNPGSRRHKISAPHAWVPVAWVQELAF